MDYCECLNTIHFRGLAEQLGPQAHLTWFSSIYIQKLAKPQPQRAFFIPKIHFIVAYFGYSKRFACWHFGNLFLQFRNTMNPVLRICGDPMSNWIILKKLSFLYKRRCPYFFVNHLLQWDCVLDKCQWEGKPSTWIKLPRLLLFVFAIEGYYWNSTWFFDRFFCRLGGVAKDLEKMGEVAFLISNDLNRWFDRRTLHVKSCLIHDSRLEDCIQIISRLLPPEMDFQSEECGTPCERNHYKGFFSFPSFSVRFSVGLAFDAIINVVRGGIWSPSTHSLYSNLAARRHWLQ